MPSKYDTLQRILKYCRTHHTRDFFQFNVGVHPRSIGAICDNGYRSKQWIARVGRSQERDGTHGNWKYRLLDHIDL